MTHPKRILVIDDDLFILKLMEVSLSQEGFAVTTIGDTETGFILLEHNPFDLVVVDLVMPGMNGFEFVRQMKKDPRSKHIPVLIITARNAKPDLEEARSVGALDVLIKPFLPFELVGKIKTALGGK